MQVPPVIIHVQWDFPWTKPTSDGGAPIHFWKTPEKWMEGNYINLNPI